MDKAPSRFHQNSWPNGICVCACVQNIKIIHCGFIWTVFQFSDKKIVFLLYVKISGNNITNNYGRGWGGLIIELRGYPTSCQCLWFPTCGLQCIIRSSAAAFIYWMKTVKWLHACFMTKIWLKAPIFLFVAHWNPVSVLSKYQGLFSSGNKELKYVSDDSVPVYEARQ